MSLSRPRSPSPPHHENNYGRRNKSAKTMSEEESIEMMEPGVRESILFDWITKKCAAGKVIDLDEGWSMLDLYGLKVLQQFLCSDNSRLDKPFSNRGYSSLYTISFSLCGSSAVSLHRDDFSQYIYQRLNVSIEEFLRYKIVPWIKSHSGVTVAKEFLIFWQRYRILTKWVFKLFMHLDRGWVTLRNAPTLTSCALNLFYGTVFQDTVELVRAGIIGEITKERNGEQIDTTFIKEVISVFRYMGNAVTVSNVDTFETFLHAPVDLDAYKRHFEEHFLNVSREYYYAQGIVWIDLPVQTFLFQLEQVYTLEANRCLTYLDSSTWPALEKVITEELVLRHIDRLTDAMFELFKDVYELPNCQTCNVELHSEKCVNLSRMYKIMNRCTQIDEAPQFNVLPLMAVKYHYFIGILGADIIEKKVAKDKAGGDNIPKNGVSANSSQSFFSSSSSSSISEATGVSPSLTTSSSEGRKSLAGGTNDKDEQSHSVVGSDQEFIESTIAMFKRINEITNHQLEDSYLFQREAKKALTNFVNLPVGSHNMSSLLSGYCDKLLKGSIRVDDLDSTLDKCIHIFTLIADKDLFIEMWRQQLGKRLLNRRFDFDTEKMIVGKIKMESGGSLTSKVEGMLNDFVSATDINAEFDAYVSTLTNPDKYKLDDSGCPIDEVTGVVAADTIIKLTSLAVQTSSFHALVLTDGHWPVQRRRDIHLPPELDAWKTIFTKWYKKKNDSRKLKWIYTQGEVVVKATYNPSTSQERSYDVSLAVVQYVVLRLFNRSNTTLSFGDIEQMTGMYDQDCLKRVLHSLSLQKIKLLEKSPPSRQVGVNDTFTVVNDVKHRSKKIKIPLAVMDETDVAKTVQVDRTSMVDASIVRILKARKRLSHSNLELEVWQQLSSFQPEKKLIKQRIESLIEREYMRRDETDTSVYVYVP